MSLLVALLLSVATLVIAPTAMAASYPYAAPKSLTAISTSNSAVGISWTPVQGAPRYRIKYSTSKKMKSPKYRNADSAWAAIPGLKPSKTYYMTVRVISKDAKKSLSPYSSKIKVTTRSKGSSYVLLPPMGLKAGAAAADSVPLTWLTAGKGLAYAIAWSTNSTFSGSSYRYTEGTSSRVYGLKPDTTYYLRARVVSGTQAARSAYSPPVTVRTATLTQSAPTGLTLTADGPTKVAARWTPVAGATHYRVGYSTSSSMSPITFVTVTGAAATLTGLRAATTYHVLVAVADAGGGTLGPASSRAYAATKAASSASVEVASFNVHSVSRFGDRPNEGTWAQRRSAVAATILAEKPDVIGLQEASQAQLGTTDDSQFDDLLSLLGKPYRLTNAHHYNCVNSVSPVSCVSQYRGASGGTRIAYNDDTVALVSQGSKQLSGDTSLTTARHVAWAIFLDRSSGKQFFFADVHLDARMDSGGKSTYYNLRTTQTKEVLAEIAKRNPDHLPTYVVGDFNSHKWREPTNAPYDTMQAAGYVDPLGNSYRSTQYATAATVERRINTNCSSFNDFNRENPCKTYLNGTYIDYIWTSKGIAVAEFETVIKLQAGLIVDRIPSDHNLIRASTTFA